MKIAVIGAGISGLAAGRVLYEAGHHVVVFEENRSFGGKLASVPVNGTSSKTVDIGVPVIESEKEEFRVFIDQLKKKNLIQEWEGTYERRSKDGDFRTLNLTEPHYIARKGAESIAQFLGRPLDIRFNEKVGGITNIGEDRIKKRTWMLNFPTAATENFDAVIIAAPPRQAYAILNLTADEKEALKLISLIDEVRYRPQFTLVAGYQHADMPDWNMLECEDEVLSRVINESRKTENSGDYLVFYTTPEFAEKHQYEDKDFVSSKILERAGEIIGNWTTLPVLKAVNYWKYAWAENPLPYDYLESENEEKPLALVGGYLNGNSLESAYLSGLKLGKHWAEKYAH